ncbi:hypothetical protein [Nitrincola sp. A-D6]|uniref:hypothetical protein n=1 Tax=Nitrincola sp. A-D6 TaxID=1545442 RepID=UPI000A952675|nr:hypothetical protein [Nitrincola sp. A-D6]
MNKYGAEFFGTFWLVLGGCGSAVLAATFPDVGIGLVGVSLAFGLTVLTMLTPSGTYLVATSIRPYLLGFGLVVVFQQKSFYLTSLHRSLAALLPGAFCI